MKTAVYIINKLPSGVLNGISPYEKLHAKKPSLDHLKVIECLCHAKFQHEIDKLMSKSRQAILMGYSETQKGYILYDDTNKVFFVHRDVPFREGIFSFKQVKDNATMFLAPSQVVLEKYQDENLPTISTTEDTTTIPSI